MSKIVTFKLDKERNFKYPYSSLKKLEELFGKPLMVMDDAMTFDEVQVLVFCGLLWEDKKLTLDKTGDILEEYFDTDEASYADLVQSAMKAVQLSLGKNSLPSKK